MTEAIERPAEAGGVPVRASAGLVSNSLARWLGPPSLIPGEDRAGYEALLGQVAAAIKPIDIIEEMWVRDVVDLAWDAFRLRRLKANLMTAAAHEGLRTVLSARSNVGDGIPQLVDRWVLRKAEAVAEVQQRLASADLGMDAVMACTLSKRIKEIERIDRMTTGVEVRRSAALREIERHRESFAQRLRRTIDQVEDAEFSEIASPQAVSGEAPT